MSDHDPKLHHLDAKRLLCPMPVIKTQNKIKTLETGDTLEVISTDPGVKQDIPAWCRINGHTVISVIEADNEYIIKIQVG